MKDALRKVVANTSSCQVVMATCRYAYPRDIPWSPSPRPPCPWGSPDAQSVIRQRYLPTMFLLSTSPPTFDVNTYGHQPRYCHFVTVLRVKRHQYPDTLVGESIRREYLLIRRHGLTWWINAADNEVPQIFSVTPRGIVGAFRRNDPRITFGRKAVENSPPKGPVRNVVLQKETLLFCLLALNLAQSPNEVALRIPGGSVPSVNRYEDLLSYKGWSLSGTKPDAG